MNIQKLVRENIKKLKPYTSARSSHLEGLLLDANENSYGSVTNEFEELELNRYPDPSHNLLREKLSSNLGVDKQSIFCGVGSDEIIDLLIRIFCEPGKDKAVIVEPTYGMYKVACDINNVGTIGIELTDDFQIDLEKVTIVSNNKLLFLCSPNNPTANLLRTEDIIKCAESFSGIVIVDQAYVEFAVDDNLLNYLKDVPNLVVLRTFSKAWGLAGIRCGYAITDPYIVKLLMKVKAPYNLNRLTISAALKALGNIKKKDLFVEQINKEKERVIEQLSNVEGVLSIFPTDANFILFRVYDADAVYNKLVSKGIIIRSRSNQLKLKGCLRVTIGKPEENEKFLTALKEVL